MATVKFGLSQKNCRKLIDSNGFFYLRNNFKKEGTEIVAEYWRCVDRKCPGRFIYYPASGEGNLTASHSHTEGRAKDAAIERLRELTLAADESVKAIDIVRTLLKELPPETRAVLPDESQLSIRVRRWARSAGINLIKSTYEDYLVEDGLEDVIPPPPPQAQAGSSNQPTPSTSNQNVDKGPELVFLKGKGGEKHRVMIGGTMYIWTRDLEKNGSIYRCGEFKNGCKVTAKVVREEKTFEIRGQHEHNKPQARSAPKPFSKGSLRLVDEEGRDLGNVSLDHILTLGEEKAKRTLDYDEIMGGAEAQSSAQAVVGSSDSFFTQSFCGTDTQEDPLAVGDTMDCFDDGPADDDFGGGDFDFESAQQEASQVATPTPKVEQTLSKSRTISTSSLVKSNVPTSTKDAQKSGERCFVCGDELIVSETLACSEETFRKACRYLNVKSKGEWFRKNKSGEFYSFCQSCTTEIMKIHQLYKQVEDLQSAIFKRVEHVEKRIADAEIVDNWMADAPAISIKRFEGFRKEVLINYRNKLKLRREIRFGNKIGHNFVEIQPNTSPQMFASDPASTDAFCRVVPDPCTTSSNNKKRSTRSSSKQEKLSCPPPTAKRSRGRPKSRKQNVPEPEPEFDFPLLDDTPVGEVDDFSHFDDNNDDPMSDSSEREVKFWENDPSKLTVRKDKDDDDNDNSDNQNNGRKGRKGRGGSTKKGGKRRDGDDGTDSDPDYNVDDDDEEWSASTKTARNRTGSSGSKRRQKSATVSVAKKVERVKSMAERFAEAREARLAAKLKSQAENGGNSEPSSTATTEREKQPEPPKKRKPHSSLDFEFPDAVLRKDGRVFLEGVEIIKNPPGVLRRRPYSVSFTCGYVTCGKIIQSFWRMKQHICGHHLSMYKCEICLKEFSEPKSLRRHNLVMHSEHPISRTPCPVCARPIVDDNKSMKYHQWSHLSEEEKKDPQYKSWCPHSKRDPNRIKRNQGAQTYMCTYCSKTFYSWFTLRKHEQTHISGESQEFQCQYCGKIYDSRKSCHQHTRKCGQKSLGIVDSQTYPCSKCPVRFKTRATRSKHMRRFHSNTNTILPFSCPKCPRSFSTKSGFKQHKRVCVDAQSRSRRKNAGPNSPQPEESPNLFGELGQEQKFEPQEQIASLSAGGPVPGAFLGGFNYSSVFGNYQDGSTARNQQPYQ